MLVLTKKKLSCSTEFNFNSPWRIHEIQCSFFCIFVVFIYYLLEFDKRIALIQRKKS